jgi:O-antigen/teichoic acid export membrane protein
VASLGELTRLPRALRNVGWSAIAGVANGVAVVLVTPLYVERLGLDRFGIVGVWLTLQVLVGFLDLGFGAALMRHVAAPATDLAALRARAETVRTLELVAWGVAALLALVLVAGAPLLQDSWLHWREGGRPSIVPALALMGASVALQFPSLLYTSGLLGLQEHGRVAIVQVATVVLRYGGGATVVALGYGLDAFFAVQVVAAVLQTLVLRALLRARVLVAAAEPTRARRALLAPLWRFSAGMASTSLLAVLVSNADRALVSRFLPAAELGRYAIAFTATGLLQLAIQPFYRAYFPRYAELVAAGDERALAAEYLRSCRLLSGVLVPLGVTGVVFAGDLLYAWLGRRDDAARLLVQLLIGGVTLAGLGWLPAAFQQANGWTGLHTRMMAVALAVGLVAALALLPVLGAPAATLVWLAHGLTGLTLELRFMHRRLLPGALGAWYRDNLVRPLVVAIPVAFALVAVRPVPTHRLVAALWPAASAGVTLLLLLRRTRAVATGVPDLTSTPG